MQQSESIVSKGMESELEEILLVVLTTASQGGGWVPEISKSFHYWQRAPRWRLVPWLANPVNPAMRPHALRETGTRHTSDKDSGNWKGGRGNTTLRDEHINAKPLLTPANKCNMIQEHVESCCTCK